MTHIARIKDVVLMKILPPTIAMTLGLGMIAGVMFLSILPYIPK